MSVADIQAGIESTLSGVTGLTVADDALFLSVPARALPAAGVVLAGPPVRTQTATGMATMVATFRVSVAFSVGSPTRFKEDALDILPRIATAMNRDPSLGGSCETHTLASDGTPQIDATLSPPVAAYVLTVEAQYEEAL
jgi:hypothetical protein